MEDDDPLKSLKSALHLITMYKNEVCNPEVWKPYISGFPKLQCVIAKAYKQAIIYEKDFRIDVRVLKNRVAEDDENSESEDSDDEHSNSEDGGDESHWNVVWLRVAGALGTLQNAALSNSLIEKGVMISDGMISNGMTYI